MHWNINSLYQNKDELEVLIREHNPFIISLNETRHSNEYDLKIPGYKSYGIARVSANNTPTNGVAVCIKENFVHKQITINTELQAVAVEVMFPFKCSVLSLYLPPSLIVSENELDNLIAQLPAPVIILGDLNAHHTSWGSRRTSQRGTVVRDFADENDLMCLNRGEPTRIGTYQNRRTESVIDLALISIIAAPNFHLEVLDSAHTSDHVPMLLKTFESIRLQKQKKWKFDKADWDLFRREVNLNSIDLNLPIDQINEKIITKIIEAADLSIPKFKNIVDGARCKPWWTPEIAEARKKRLKLERLMMADPTPTNIANFREQRWEVKKLILLAKEAEINRFIEELDQFTSSSTIWKKLHSIRGVKRAPRTYVIRENDVSYSEENIIAEKFNILFEKRFNEKTVNNSTFDKKIKKVKKKLKQNKKKKFDESVNCEIKMEELELVLKNAKNTSPGYDKIHYTMIQHLTYMDKYFLIKFFNRIWQEGSIPPNMKKGVMIPIPKNQDEMENINNYRPIQMLPVIAKILEKIVSNRLNHMMEMQGITDRRQSGFRRRRSVEDNLAALDILTRENFINGRQVLALFFDLEKAYDKVGRQPIIKHLEHLGFHGPMFAYIKSFLSDRSFYVRVANAESSTSIQEEGVPQGSSLSVQIFKLVMDLIGEYIDYEHLYFFADDIVYLRPIDDADDEFQETTQNHIDDLCAWAHSFGLNFSQSKTKWMVLRKRRSSKQFPWNFQLYGRDIERVTEIKFLGLLIDETLSFNKHIEQTVDRAKNNINIIKYMGNNKMGVKRNWLFNVMNAIVRSVLEYGGLIFANLTKANKRKMMIAMNTALRVCLGAKKSTRIESLYAESGYLSIEDRLQISRCNYVIRVRNNAHHFLHGQLDWISRRLSEQGRQSPYFNTSIGRAVWTIDFHQLSILKSPPVIVHPIWQENNIKFDKSLMIYGRANFDNSRWRMLARELEDKYRDCEIVYSDGSKRDDETAYAVTTLDEVVFQEALPKWSSSYTAEMTAIVAASHTNTEKSSIVCMSDSLSSILAIESRKEGKDTTRWALNYINRDKEFILVWIPGHCGIDGNIMADKHAKEALDRPPFTEYTPEDAKRVIKNIMRQKDEWNWQGQVDNKLRQIKDDTKRSILHEKLSRKQEKIITRLRLGHTVATHNYLMEGERAPECEICKVSLTVKHIFVECIKFVKERDQFKISLDSLKNHSHHLKVIEFLKAIKMYNEM